MISIYAAVATTGLPLVFATAGIPAVRAQPSINAECSEQTVEYGSGAIRQWSQELLASQTYTWSTVGQTSEDTYIRIFLEGATDVLAYTDDNRGTLQSSLTWSPDADGTYVVEVAAWSRGPIRSDGNFLLYFQPSACDESETTTVATTPITTRSTTATATEVQGSFVLENQQIDRDRDALAGVAGVTSSADGLSVYAAAAGMIVSWRRHPATNALVNKTVYRKDRALYRIPGRGAAYKTVAVTPNGRHVYATDSVTNEVVWWARCTETGNLTNGSSYVDALHLDGAHGLSVSDDGRYVYVTASRANSVLTFNRDADTGALDNMRHFTDNTWLHGAHSIVVAGTSVHIAAFDADAVITFARDADTGVLGRMTRNESPDHLAAVHNLVLSHDHTSLYAAGFNSASVVHWQRSHSGRLWGRSVIQQPVTLNYVRDVAIAEDGLSVYALTYYNIVSFARDPVNGRLYDQVTRTDPALSNGQAIAIATDGRVVLAVAEGANTLVSWDRTFVPRTTTVEPSNTADADARGTTSATTDVLRSYLDLLLPEPEDNITYTFATDDHDDATETSHSDDINIAGSSGHNADEAPAWSGVLIAAIIILTIAILIALTVKSGAPKLPSTRLRAARHVEFKMSAIYDRRCADSLCLPPDAVKVNMNKPGFTVELPGVTTL